jgi:hypothetical protein
MNNNIHYVLIFYILNLNVTPKMAKCQYKEQFLDLHFTHITEFGVVKPHCVTCPEMLSNEMCDLL